MIRNRWSGDNERGTAHALLLLIALLLTVSGARAQYYGPRRDEAPTKKLPPSEIVQDVTIDQKLDAQVPLDLPFRDENGRAVMLSDYFGEKPIVLTLNYYECPMLCTQIMNGTLKSLNVMTFDIGKEFDVVTVSIDPRETPELAAKKKKQYTKQYRRGPEIAEKGWHFLTGDSASIARLADAVGFRYVYDPKSDEYAHASGIMLLTPKGKLARYFYGIEYSPDDMRKGLIDASNGTIGSPVEKIIMLCFEYDPTTGKYGLVITRVIQAFGIVTMLGLVAFIAISARRDKRRLVSAEALKMRKEEIVN